MRYCEAMVQVRGGAWTRCGKRPVERHHRLTRARGGAVLDAAGETYHLIDLCPRHHRMSDGRDAYENGLLLDGYVTTGPDGEPVYHGSDPYLSDRYPRRALPLRVLREMEGSSLTGEGLRDET